MGCTTSLSEKPEAYHQPAIRYGSIAEVQAGLTSGGLDSANLILGVDFTSPTGEATYLHVIKVIGEVFESFIDQEYPIHAFGIAHDRRLNKSLCFPFSESAAVPDLGELMSKYQELAACLRSQEGGSWGPVVRRAIEVVRKTGRYHVLLLLSSDPNNTDKDTQNAIEEAAAFPMAIVQIGVGPGPWDKVQEFAERGMARSNSINAMLQNDGFQFLAFDQIATRFEGSKQPLGGRSITPLPPIPKGSTSGSRRQSTVARPAAADWKQLGKAEAIKLNALQDTSSCSAARFAWEALSGLPMHYKAVKTSGIKRTISGWSIGQGTTVARSFPDPQPFDKGNPQLVRGRSATWPVVDARPKSRELPRSTTSRELEGEQWAACVVPGYVHEARPVRQDYVNVAVGDTKRSRRRDSAGIRRKSALGKLHTLSWSFDPTENEPPVDSCLDSGFTGYKSSGHKRSSLLEAGVTTGVRTSSLIGDNGLQMPKWGKVANCAGK